MNARKYLSSQHNGRLFLASDASSLAATLPVTNPHRPVRVTSWFPPSESLSLALRGHEFGVMVSDPLPYIRSSSV
jgi:hypothetical protein